MAEAACRSRHARCQQALCNRGFDIVLMIVFSFASPYFTPNNLSALVSSEAVPLCLAFAALFPLVIGEFDLRWACSSASSLWPVRSWRSWIDPPSHRDDRLGAFIGAINGYLVVILRISAFIATFATGIFWVLSNGISNGQIIFGDVPQVLIDIGRGRFLGVGIAIWFVLIIAILLVYLLEHTPLGRRLYAIGGSEAVAFMAGVPTRELRIFAFTMAGVLVGVGSVFQPACARAAIRRSGRRFSCRPMPQCSSASRRIGRASTTSSARQSRSCCWRLASMA